MKRIGWLYPEWWALSLSLLAWVAMVSEAFSSGMNHVAHHHLASVVATQPQSWLAGTGHLLLMVIAMMFPFVIGPVRGTAARSLWFRRHRAIAGFLTGYLAVWVLLGFLLILAQSRMALNAHVPASLAVA